MKALKAIIIDDEPDCVKLLALQMKMYCPEVQVIATCLSAEDGFEKIIEHSPDMVFLDIEMPRINGFQLLERLGEITFSLIFVTAYDRFAVKAFRYSALDYLLKPIDGKDLLSAVQKAVQRQGMGRQQLNLLKEVQASPKAFPEKIALPFQNGVTFVEVRNIIYCESENNYTRFHTTDGQQYLAAKTLGDIQELLEEGNFLRVHRQYVVNLDQIAKYVRGEGNYLVLSNGKSVSVARTQKEKLIQKFGWL